MNNTKIGIANIISLGFVIAIIILFVFASPFTLGEYRDTGTDLIIKDKPVGHLERSLLMLAIFMFPSALCHGLNLKVKSTGAKLLTSPWLIWPLMFIGIAGTLYLK